jgi:hypothetical protein
VTPAAVGNPKFSSLFPIMVWRWLTVRAKVGDELMVKGRRQGDKDRHGEIIEIRGEKGAPPYLVRWQDSRESVFFPSADAVVVRPRRSG